MYSQGLCICFCVNTGFHSSWIKIFNLVLPFQTPFYVFIHIHVPQFDLRQRSIFKILHGETLSRVKAIFIYFSVLSGFICILFIICCITNYCKLSTLTHFTVSVGQEIRNGCFQGLSQGCNQDVGMAGVSSEGWTGEESTSKLMC